jgi:hypothetical protein
MKGIISQIGVNIIIHAMALRDRGRASVALGLVA